MKRIFTTFSIFIALIYLLNSYISYYYFEFALPSDLFRYPYRELSKDEVVAWKFALQWVIPGAIVLMFMWATRIHNRATRSWAVIVLNITVFIILARIPVLYLASQVQGGGASFAAKAYLSYMNIPVKIGLLVGTLGLFITLRPLDRTPTQ